MTEDEAGGFADRDEAELWALLRGEQPLCAQVRETLILRYAPLVRYVAFRVAARLADTLPREDLISFGMFGLIDALDRYDPTLGVKFESYATTRIQGSIIDELRALDWAPRSVRARARWVKTTCAELEQRLHREPTVAEIAAELTWTVAEVRAAQLDGDVSYIDALPDGGDDEDSTTSSGSDPMDITAEDPALAAEVELTRQALAKALARLPEKERAVAYMYWAVGLTLGEIGAVLGVSESWVCQLYTTAALRLREQLAYLR